MKFNRAILAVAAIATLSGGALAETWKIDTLHSTVGFKVRHFFAKQAGEFNEFTGTIEFDPANPEAAFVEAVIQTASVDTDDEKRDGHLRSADFFDAENHPEILFKSTNVARGGDGFIVTGDLTMRGVTKEVSFELEFLGHGPDPWGGTRAGFAAELVLNRKDFDVKWNNVLDNGGTVLGDKVTVSLDIEAVVPKEEPGR